MAKAAAMSHAHSHGTVPRLPLMALGAMVLMVVLAVAMVRITGKGAVHVPDAPPAAMRELLFEDRPDGSIVVLDARDRRLVETVAPESNGFLRGTMRGLARERKRQGIGPELPFQLIGRSDGRLTLVDPGTGRRVDLESFGPTNAAAFSRLMSAP